MSVVVELVEEVVELPGVVVLPELELVEPDVLDEVLLPVGSNILHEINVPIIIENKMIIANNLFIISSFHITNFFILFYIIFSYLLKFIISFFLLFIKLIKYGIFILLWGENCYEKKGNITREISA